MGRPLLVSTSLGDFRTLIAVFYDMVIISFDNLTTLCLYGSERNTAKRLLRKMIEIPGKLKHQTEIQSTYFLFLQKVQDN